MLRADRLPALARRDLGRLPYLEAWELQHQLVDARRAGHAQDQLLFCEHDEVITTGRRAQSKGRPPAELELAKEAGLPVVAIERGGAATYHGPGQLVGYPIVRLEPEERDLHRFLRAIEGSLIAALSGSTKLRPTRREGYTGVWVEEQKVASIGIACRGWVTYHGFALNLDVDSERFRLFRPCDLDPEVMTSLVQLGVQPDREELKELIWKELSQRLGRRPAP